MESSTSNRTLPENAYRKLKPGESYQPIVPATDLRAEVTPWAVGMALVLVLIFSAACIYMALRAGSGIEAAIPIAILAIFFGKARKLKSTILENVIVQSIGQASGVVAAGAAFTIPALYINGLKPVWWQIFLACAVGGVLGTVLIIPLRRYFVAERHGDLPFPEATATTEILVAGESAGKTSGRVLLISFGLGALYDFLVEAVHAWNPAISTKALLGTIGEKMYSVRTEIKMNALAALFGLGYIIGVRYAAIIAAGSVLAYVVMVPLIYVVGGQVTDLEFFGRHVNVSAMSAGEIFNTFVKPVSIGAIAVSGLIGIIRMSKIIVRAVTLGFKGLSHKHGDSPVHARTDRDMSPRTVILIQLGGALAMAVLFFIVTIGYSDAGAAGYSVGQSFLFAGAGAVIGFALAFLFTPVAAEAIAIVGTNPVSGMTMITLILASLVMTTLGLAGNAGIFIAIVIGCAVCTALSTAGALISDFKIGYWIGSTPAKQQGWKFLGVFIAAITCAFVVPLMDSSYQFLVHVNPLDLTSPLTSNTDVLPAPQANMLAAIVKGMMTQGGQPYFLYALGGFVALMLYMAGVPPLAFSLGMYLPISITLAQLFGAVVSWVVGNTGKTEKVKKARSEQGVLIASGMMAGAAIIGIVTAILRLDWTGYLIRYLSIGVDYVVQMGPTGSFLAETPPLPGAGPTWYQGFGGQGLGFVMYLVLALICFFLARWGATRDLEERAQADSSKS
jgi:putative OPT family oligopeptide transporter